MTILKSQTTYDKNSLPDELMDEAKALHWQMYDFKEFVAANTRDLQAKMAFLCRRSADISMQ